MIGEINVGGGVEPEEFIKGVIQEAKAQGVVTAGDFVSFLTDYSESNKSSNTAINTTSGTNKAMSAVALDKNRVFIAYFHPSGVSGIVCTIQGSTIAVGTHTILYSGGNMGLTVSAVALNASKVFVAYSYGSSYKLYAITCTIQGSTITVGTNTQLSTVSNSGKVISAVKLDEGKVFIAYLYGNYYNSIVCAISGTTITVGTEKTLANISMQGYALSAVKLDEDRVFVAYGGSSSVNYSLYGIVCVIKETSITTPAGTGSQLDTALYSGKAISAVKLDEGKVFIAHSANNSYALNGLICTISGTSITVGTDTVLNSTSGTGKIISAIALNESEVQIMHVDSNNYLYSMLCNINGATITKENDVQLSSIANSGTVISAIALSENNIFIGNSSGPYSCLYGMVIGYLANLAKTITSLTEEIGGVAITSGTSGQTVNIKKPNV